MNHKTVRNLMIALGLAAALAALFATLQVASAQNATPAGVAAAAPTFPEPPDELQGVRFVHQATAANTSGHITYIDHYLTNGDPDALVFVTQNTGLADRGVSIIGVYYSSGEGKWAIFNQDFSPMDEGAAFNILIPNSGTHAFVHEATVGNTSGHITYIEHPLTHNPDAILLVTQNWNPGGGAGIYNNHPIGVRYDSGEGKWGVFNQDGASMLPGASFNVLVRDPDANVFTHKATAGNTDYDYTLIDHPLVNGNTHALMYVTQNWNPAGMGGVTNTHDIAIWYCHWEQKWCIFNQDGADMPEGAAFNVAIPTNDTAFFVHQATAGNSYLNYTLIDHSLTNDNPHAIAFATQNWNPGGGTVTSNNYEIGLWYSGLFSSWSIFNQRYYTRTMPTGAAFNVLVPNVDAGVFIHRATAENTTLNQTRINHPLTYYKPNAIVFITPNWDPGGLGGTYNDHVTGVYYNSTAHKWAIFNQDLAPMPISATFNVMVPPSDASVFVHRATDENTPYYDATCIDYPLANGNPHALVFVTQNRNPDGGAGIYNDHTIAVGYDDITEKWCIVNQDGGDITEGAAFNVMVKAYGVYLPLVVR